jgi:hypothetical protein
MLPFMHARRESACDAILDGGEARLVARGRSASLITTCRTRCSDLRAAPAPCVRLRMGLRDALVVDLAEQFGADDCHSPASARASGQLRGVPSS